MIFFISFIILRCLCNHKQMMKGIYVSLIISNMCIWKNILKINIINLYKILLKSKKMLGFSIYEFSQNV